MKYTRCLIHICFALPSNR